MNSQEKIKFILFAIYSIFVLLLTTNYLTLNSLIYDANQTDIISYTTIANAAPSLLKDSDIVIQHVAQRFLVPFIVGISAKFFNIELFLTYKIYTFFLIIFLVIFIYYIINKLNLNFNEAILFYSLFVFNPYTIRYHLFNPVQAHDLIFFLTGFCFSYGIIKEKKKFTYYSSLSSILLRQTGIAMAVGTLIDFYQSKNSKYKNIFLYLLVFSILLIIISKVGHYISVHKFHFLYSYGIIYYDFMQIERLIKFLLLPMVSFFPIIFIFFLGERKNNINKMTLLILLFVCLLMIGQPIAAGPDGSSRNIVRITTLCYPILLCLVFYLYKLEKFFQKKIIFYLFIIFLQIWSLHPTFSIIKLFSILRF